MTRRELLYIKTIAEEKSVSKAAEKLFVSQPTLSHCVINLERELGTQLFVRSTLGLRLTYAGERYCQAADQILRIYSNLEQEVYEINDLKKGRITVGMTNYLATWLLPMILPAFKHQYPNLDVELVEENSTMLESDLTARKLDFALMHTAPSVIEDSNRSLDYFPLQKDPFVIVAHKGTPLCAKAVYSPNVTLPVLDPICLEGQPFIMVARGQRIRQMTDFILNQAGCTPSTVLTTKSHETARRLACQGLGVTFVPWHYTKIFTDNYEPEYFAIPEKYQPYWTLVVANVKNGFISTASQVFIHLLNQEMKNTEPLLLE